MSSRPLQRSGNGVVVRPRRNGLAAVELERSVQPLAAGMVMVEADGGSVRPDPKVDAMLMISPVLGVGDGRERSSFKGELLFEPVPILGTLVLRPGAIRWRVGMHVVERRLGPSVRPQPS